MYLILMRNSVSINIWIIACCWLAVNVFLYATMGTKYAIDTTRFDTEAAAWLKGQFEPSYHFWYAGYIFILAISKLFFQSIYPSIVFQCALSLCATVSFYKGLSRILKNESIACIAALLTILYMPVQQWNLCLLTESVFISLVLLFIRAYSIEKDKTKWICMFLISLTAASVRPNGGMLLITCLVFFLVTYSNEKNKKLIYAISLLFSIVFFLILNYSTEVFYQFLFNSFEKGEIICGYSGWVVSVKNTSISNSSAGSITKITQLFLAHPLEITQLGLYRFAALWSDVRLYYSTLHNLFTALFLSIAYISAIIGFIQYRNTYAGLAKITLLYAGGNSLLIMITYADWDGRFLAPLLPVVFIWSALGIYYSIHFLKCNNTFD